MEKEDGPAIPRRKWAWDRDGDRERLGPAVWAREEGGMVGGGREGRRVRCRGAAWRGAGMGRRGRLPRGAPDQWSVSTRNVLVHDILLWS
jgi:hypothetical protein